LRNVTRMTPAMKRSSAATALLIALAFVAVKPGAPRPQTEGPVIKLTMSLPARETRVKVPLSEISHKRVTDSDTAAALGEMSPFEIPGLRRQARYGDESAALLLGMAYEVGYGLPPDCIRAAYWVGEAANGGNAAAAFNLGLRYRDGDGVPVRLDESYKWLRKAAAQNYPGAQIAVGTLTSNQSHLSLAGQ
jgi:TPR repeat protein